MNKDLVGWVRSQCIGFIMRRLKIEGYFHQKKKIPSKKKFPWFIRIRKEGRGREGEEKGRGFCLCL